MPICVPIHGDYLFNQLDNPELDDVSHLVTWQQSCQRPSREVRRNGACANHDVHRHVEASNAVQRGARGRGGMGWDSTLLAT